MDQILIVDDDVSSRKLARYALQGNDGCFYESDNGEEALTFVLNENPGLIILDWKMPKLGGEDMIHLLNSILPYVDKEKSRSDVLIYSSIPFEDMWLPRSEFFRFVSYVSKKWPADEQVRKMKSIFRKINGQRHGKK